MMTNDEPLLNRKPTVADNRDAIHLAIIAVKAKNKLTRGQRVEIVNGEAVATRNNGVGIVNPFLEDGEEVHPGARFWLVLHPGTIRSIRHEWTHPAFPIETINVEASSVVASEKWLREMAEETRSDYDEILQGAISGDGGCFGADEGPEIARRPEFWQHVENVTGRRFDHDHREGTWFRCAC
jgi:hypothetical protein